MANNPHRSTPAENNGIPLHVLVNDFAIRSFRDIADGDYIAARMACKCALVTQFLWAGQQAIEKYLKCILLLNRIPAADIKHNLGKALDRINSSGKLTLDLTKGTDAFIKRLDESGEYRYLEISIFGSGAEIVPLDRAVWEVRRYCTLYQHPRQVRLTEGVAAPRVRLPGGMLEKIIDSPAHPARKPLIWQNGFFGNRLRKKAYITKWFRADNAPLSLHPEILPEVLKYVYLPKDIKEAYSKYKEMR